MRSAAVRAFACLAAVLALPVTLLAFVFGIPAQYEATFLGGLRDKWDALAAAEGRRIVVAGGSGAAFGLRSDLLEEELPGWSVVNFGLYAGLGTTVMLDLAKPLLREGDVVVFSPEQSAQTLSTYFNPEAMWQAADGRPELLTPLGGEYRGPLAGEFVYFAAEKARLVRDGSAPEGEGVYARASFNGYGDMACSGRERNVMPGGFDPNMPISFDPALPEENFFVKLNSFTQWCEERGITVYYRFCSMNAAAVADEERERMEEYLRYFAGRLDCEVLGSPDRAVMAPEWFFDTNFHLNSAGAVVNTAAFAEELKTALGDSTPVVITLPEMPSMAGAEMTDGDNGDGTYFLYEQSGDGLRLTGLTEEGAQQEKLTLPVSRDGVPVVGFSPAVFTGNTVVREIVIQENIRWIEDRSFDGCTALERLTMRQTAPELCSVGAGLLEGTQALVWVRSERLSAYRTNYFWSPHASRICGEGESAPVSDPPAQTPVRTGADILYEGNGGTLKAAVGDSIALPMDLAHLRVNTAQGTRYFQREGYVLTGWNTEADGSGRQIGLGSRVERENGLVLYAQWKHESPEEDFLYVQKEGEVWITGYRGSGEVCVVPGRISGVPVRRICANAFRSAAFTQLVLPPEVTAVEKEAFIDCAVQELWLFDTLREVWDESFGNCSALRRLHINAAVSPVYSGSYFDTFSDKYDWLLSLRNARKIVLFSGSSGRYGYDSAAIRSVFPEYQAVNMGVYAYTNALPQLDLILPLMSEGDVLLSAPEFDAAEQQFCASDRLDAAFWAMMESNYDAAAELELQNYSGVFDSFGEYQRVRGGMAGRNYGDSPWSYDDDGNYYAFPTYNQYGDLILPRPNGEKDVRLRHNIADYTVNSFPPEYLESLNEVYARFEEKGVAVYFNYTPRNRSSLTEESTPQARRALHSYLTEGLRVPVISDIEDCLYSGIYFYLIDSHLSTEGAAMHTRKVIAALRPWLE